MTEKDIKEYLKDARALCFGRQQELCRATKIWCHVQPGCIFCDSCPYNYDIMQQKEIDSRGH